MSDAQRFNVYGQRLDDHEPRGSAHFVRASDYDALAARLAAVEAECADLIAGKEYQAMQRTLAEMNAKFVKVWEKLAEAVALLERWHKTYHGTVTADNEESLECVDDDTTTFLYFAVSATTEGGK